MKITVFIIGLLAILLNVVIGEPIKQNAVNQNNKNPGQNAGEIVIGSKNPKRDSSDQTAVEDKPGQSQNYQPNIQYQSFVPVGGQYFGQAATQQVHYAKPEGGIDYAKSESAVQYVSSTHRPAAAYQTIAYSAQQPQQYNGKLVAQVAPAVHAYSHAPVQYYTLPQQQQHGHQHNIQYAIAVPAGHGHQQQFAFAALPGHGYHHGQHTAQIAYAVNPQIGHYYRGEVPAGHYSLPAHQHHHHQVPQFAVFAASAPVSHHHPTQVSYAKLPGASQQAIIYATHPGQHYFAGKQSLNLGYYQNHVQQPIYQHHAQPVYQSAYASGLQPGIQYAAKPVQATAAPISVTPAPIAHYKNYITTATPVLNHNNGGSGGAISFTKYSAQLPANPHNSGTGASAYQLIKAPVTYATTATPIATYQQHNGGSGAGKIYYAAIPAQYQDPGQAYTHPGTIHYGQQLYHPSSAGKAIISPTPPSAGQKY